MKIFEKFGNNFGTIDSGAKGIGIITGIGSAVGALIGIAGAMCNAANKRRAEAAANVEPETLALEPATSEEETEPENLAEENQKQSE